MQPVSLFGEISVTPEYGIVLRKREAVVELFKQLQPCHRLRLQLVRQVGEEVTSTDATGFSATELMESRHAVPICIDHHEGFERWNGYADLDDGRTHQGGQFLVLELAKTSFFSTSFMAPYTLSNPTKESAVRKLIGSNDAALFMLRIVAERIDDGNLGTVCQHPSWYGQTSAPPP